MMIKLKKIALLCWLIVCTISFSTTIFAQWWSDYIKSYWIDIVTSPSIDTDYPWRAKPNPWESQKDLFYRVNEVLPYEEDRDHSAYIVYPTHGIIVSVVRPNDEDTSLINGWSKFDHFTYFQKGALHYYGDSPSKWPWNMVIAAHSSYYKKDAGRYKTAFQALIVTKPGEHIRYYEKNDQWAYDLYEYEVQLSKETSKYDVSILKQDTDEQTITTYGCYPIGTTDGRWYNKAKLVNTILSHSTLSAKAKTDNTPTHQVAPIKNDEIANEKQWTSWSKAVWATTLSPKKPVVKPATKPVVKKPQPVKQTVLLSKTKNTSNKNTKTASTMIAKTTTYTPGSIKRSATKTPVDSIQLQKKKLLAMIATYNYHVKILSNIPYKNNTTTLNKNNVLGYVYNLRQEIQSLYRTITYVR